jgi:glycosyltransferase involved in cell wall biosynthesis
MYSFWPLVIEPVFSMLKPQIVVEIGSGSGANTKNILQYCRETGAVVHSVDPLPKYNVDEWVKDYGDVLFIHRSLSLEALPEIGAADAVLIDGDHNWYTVFNELKLIEKLAQGHQREFPLVFLHDIHWPYGRRDLYYNPETIPVAFRKACRKLGLKPGHMDLAVKGGINRHLYNSVYENDPQNGVLTAVEDFLKETSLELQFIQIPGFHGLGFIFPGRLARENRGFSNLLKQFELPPAVSELMFRLERSRLDEEVHRQESLAKMARLSSDAARLQGELDDAGKKLQSGEMEFVALQKHLVSEKRNAEMIREESARLRAELEAIKQELTRKESQIGGLLLRMTAAEDEADKVREKVRALRDEIRGEEPLSHPCTTEKARVSRPDNGIKTDFLFHGLVRQINERDGYHNFGSAFEDSEKAIREALLEIPASWSGPFVSIIMPTYNRAAILRDALVSVLEQTYQNWELLVCDDGSTDDTEKVVKGYRQDRIRYFKLKHGGAARARNHGLREARGSVIAYLDTDNVWHPEYLRLVVFKLTARNGYHCAYTRYIDVDVVNDKMRLRSCKSLPFNYSRLQEKNFIDLNGFMHVAEVYRNFGGMTDDLPRQQDWDLILKYTFLRDPLYLDQFLTLYRRNKKWDQITFTQKKQTKYTQTTVQKNVEGYYQNGLPSARPVDGKRKVTVLSWDICRNHFSKAYNIAECLSKTYQVQLIGFRFFEERLFPPYRSEKPPFETLYFDGCQFPDLNSAYAKALSSISGDVVYCVKPRLTSLGVGLLANYHFGKPLILENNDLETVVTNPEKDRTIGQADVSRIDFSDRELLNPYSVAWSRILETIAKKVPFKVTHNQNLNEYFGSDSFFIRNIKDERFFDPDKYDREAVRRELGFSPGERVILYGGMVRKHKGVFELLDFLEKVPGLNLRLVVVGSRETPDQKKMRKRGGSRLTILPPQGRNDMAKINYAADAVVLWLDPDIPASHYQMPYKLTDALAMKVPVIANEISDMKTLGEQGYLRLVPYGDFQAMAGELNDLLDDRKSAREMVEAGRQLYLRQFSYQAAYSNLQIIFDRIGDRSETTEAAADFAQLFSGFHSHLRRKA